MNNYCGRYGADSHHFEDFVIGASCVCGMWHTLSDDTLQANVVRGRCIRCARPLDEHRDSEACLWVKGEGVRRG